LNEILRDIIYIYPTWHEGTYQKVMQDLKISSCTKDAHDTTILDVSILCLVCMVRLRMFSLSHLN